MSGRISKTTNAEREGGSLALISGYVPMMRRMMSLNSDSPERATDGGVVSAALICIGCEPPYSVDSWVNFQIRKGVSEK